MDLPVNVLLPGERLVWSGRPRRNQGERRGLLAFGLVWAAAGLCFRPSPADGPAESLGRVRFHSAA